MLKADFSRLDQSGAKLIGAAALGRGATTGTWRAEAVAILMNPTNYKTDTFNLALDWVGDKGHLTAATMPRFSATTMTVCPGRTRC